jgi:sec-independent protein translocase protein TatA
MFGLGAPELMIILTIAVLLFGVGKLPELGSGLGRAIRGFRKAVTEVDPLQIANDATNGNSPQKPPS